MFSASPCIKTCLFTQTMSHYTSVCLLHIPATFSLSPYVSAFPQCMSHWRECWEYVHRTPRIMLYNRMTVSRQKINIQITKNLEVRNKISTHYNITPHMFKYRALHIPHRHTLQGWNYSILLEDLLRDIFVESFWGCICVVVLTWIGCCWFVDVLDIVRYVPWDSEIQYILIQIQ